MPVLLRRARTLVSFAAPVALALLGAGCGTEETVQSYKVPKSTGRAAAPPAATDFRLLGAMYPVDDPVWFLKFAGPADQVEKFEAGFDKLAAGVKLAPDGKPPEFTPPDGWTRGPGRGGVVAATVRTPDGALEVTVTQSAGGVQRNLERWVGQIGLKPTPGDREKYTRTFDAVGTKGLRVDLRGPKDPATSRGPMMGGR